MTKKVVGVCYGVLNRPRGHKGSLDGINWRLNHGLLISIILELENEKGD